MDGTWLKELVSIYSLFIYHKSLVYICPFQSNIINDISGTVMQLVWIPFAMGIFLFAYRGHFGNIFRFCWRRLRQDRDRPICFQAYVCFRVTLNAILDVFSLAWWSVRAAFCRLIGHADEYQVPSDIADEAGGVPFLERPRFQRRATAGYPRPDHSRRSRRISERAARAQPPSPCIGCGEIAESHV